jgi:hypothetical protein
VRRPPKPGSRPEANKPAPQVKIYRGNLKNLTSAASGTNPTVNFKWTINAGMSIGGAPQASPWDCAAALFYNRVLALDEYLKVEWWLNEVRAWGSCPPPQTCRAPGLTSDCRPFPVRQQCCACRCRQSRSQS